MWPLEIEKDTATFHNLYHSGEYFRTLDTKLCVAVDNLAKDNDSLRNAIMIATETLAKKGTYENCRKASAVDGILIL